MVAFDHRDPGTSEARWSSAAPWAEAPPLVLGDRRIVVLAAHPDDESLGAGGLLARAADLGLDIEVVVATDGGRAERRLESAAALAAVAPGASLRFLGLPDGGLRRHADELERLLRRLLDASPAASLVAAPWWRDGHDDHEVLGEIAIRLEHPGRRIVGYPIWLWHWGAPEEVEGLDWLRLDLDAATTERKARAISAHRSQLVDSDGAGPMLHTGTLAHFARPVEVFVTTRSRTDRSTTPPDVFDDRFDADADPWRFETRWYERRKRALLLAALPQERYGRGLELGCANGSLTVRLAERVADLLAVDGSPAALRRAKERADLPPGVRFAQHVLPGDWPEGAFDLVVFSEMGFYLSAADLDRTLDRIAACTVPGGTVVVCHWRRPVHDAPLRGDDVHAAVRAHPAFERVGGYDEEEFLLDLVTRRSP